MASDEMILRAIARARNPRGTLDDWAMRVDGTLDALGAHYREYPTPDGYAVADLADGRAVYIEPDKPYGLAIR